MTRRTAPASGTARRMSGYTGSGSDGMLVTRSRSAAGSKMLRIVRG